MSEYYNSTDGTFTPIPDAPFYALGEDTFMSGWGPAERMVNVVVVPCQNETELDNALRIMHERREIKRVRERRSKPRTKPGVLYSLVPAWATSTRTFR